MAYKKSVQTKQKIKNSAMGLFIENGYDSTTVRQIAEKAGMGNSGAIYYHYPSKEEIMRDIFEEVHQKILSHYDEIVDMRENPLLSCCVCMKALFRTMFLNDNLKNIFSIILKSEWCDSIVMERNMYFYDAWSAKYGVKVDSDNLKLFVYSTRGVETKLILEKIKGNLQIPDNMIFDYIIRFFPLMIGISQKTVDSVLGQADLVLNDNFINMNIFAE